MEKEKIIEVLKNLSNGISIDFSNAKYGIISHPLTSNIHVMNKDKDFMILTPGNMEKYVEWRCSLINDSAKSIHSIFCHINSPYLVVFLSLIKDYLTEKEFNEVLSSVWTQVEFPHQESIHNLIGLFKQSKKEILMDEEELKKLDSLPEEITIYRGLQGSKAKIKGLSWTLSLDKAKWFSKRWKKQGEVYQAKTKKDDIFMYTNSRGEEEIVVNPLRLRQLKKLEEE